MGLEEFAEEHGGVFAELAVVAAEGGEGVGVDIEFTGDFAMNEDRDNNFGFGFKRTGEIAGIGIDIVDDEGFPGGGCGTTDALIKRDAGVGRHGALEGAEDKGAGILLKHVKADPVITRELFVEKIDDALHESFGRGGRSGESVQSGNQVGCFCVRGGHEE